MVCGPCNTRCKEGEWRVTLSLCSACWFEIVVFGTGPAHARGRVARRPAAETHRPRPTTQCTRRLAAASLRGSRYHAFSYAADRTRIRSIYDQNLTSFDSNIFFLLPITLVFTYVLVKSAFVYIFLCAIFAHLSGLFQVYWKWSVYLSSITEG